MFNSSVFVACHLFVIVCEIYKQFLNENDFYTKFVCVHSKKIC